MMPSTVHFSRPRSGVMSVGVHPDDDDRALGLLGLLLRAVELGVAVLLGREQRLRGGVDEVADLELAGQDRACRRRRAPGACPAPRWSGRACRRRGRRRGPGRAAARSRAGRARRPRRAWCCAPAGGDRCRPRRARRSAPATVASRSSWGDAAGWRISIISWSAISLRARWMMPMPISSRLTAEGQTEGDRRRAEAGEGVPVVADLEGEVGDHEQDGADHRER